MYLADQLGISSAWEWKININIIFSDIIDLFVKLSGRYQNTHQNHPKQDICIMKPASSLNTETQSLGALKTTNQTSNYPEYYYIIVSLSYRATRLW